MSRLTLHLLAARESWFFLANHWTVQYSISDHGIALFASLRVSIVHKPLLTVDRLVAIWHDTSHLLRAHYLKILLSVDTFVSTYYSGNFFMQITNWHWIQKMILCSDKFKVMQLTLRCVYGYVTFFKRKTLFFRSCNDNDGPLQI